MARGLHLLSAKECGNAAPGAVLNDGGGLFLRCTTAGARRWVFRFTLRGQRREMGIGPFPAVTLAVARKSAAAARERVALGHDPIAEAQEAAERARREAEAARNAATFGTYGDDFADWRVTSAGLTSPKSRYLWTRTFKVHAASLREKPVADITREDILSVLKPIWDVTHATALLVRSHLEAMFDHAIQNGAYHRDNPARWKLFSATLSKPRKLTTGRRPAMPWADVPGFMTTLRQCDGVAALALEFLILTASRSGEVRFATWGEIDVERRLWIVPAGRMKTRRDVTRRDHVVPLTDRMMEVLTAARDFQAESYPDGEALPAGAYIFPGVTPGKALHAMALRELMTRLGVDAFVPHGFRSSFRDWAGSRPDVPRELAEEALAHALGAVESAYRREQSIERRRVVMAAWEGFLAGETQEQTGVNVIGFAARA